MKVGFVLLAVLASGCQRRESSGASASAILASSNAPPSSAQASANAVSTASAAPLSSAAPVVAVQPACCMMDRTEGIFGSRKGISTTYSGDFLRRKDGERLLFPQDLISDTKELFQHAKSAGKSIEQTRRVRVLGEGAKYVSVEIVEQGETGVTPFSHSSCQTIDLMSGRTLKVDDVIKGRGDAIIASGRAKLDAVPGHEAFRFLPGSFAMIGTGEKIVRFCAPRRESGEGDARMDVEVDAR